MSERITAIYQLHTQADPERLAATIAGEQSSGTFLAIPGEDEALKARARLLQPFGLRNDADCFAMTQIAWQ